MVPFRTTAVIPLSPYLQIHSHHSFIPFIPSRFHRCPIAHNNPSIVFAAQRGMHIISRLPSDTSSRNPPERTEDNLKILHHALILNPLHVIPNLVRHNLLDIRLVGIFRLPLNHVLIHILYRCPIRNARSNRQHLLLFLSIEASISLNLRSRPYKTHITDKHVPKLWQFIILYLRIKYPILVKKSCAIYYSISHSPNNSLQKFFCSDSNSSWAVWIFFTCFIIAFDK